MAQLTATEFRELWLRGKRIVQKGRSDDRVLPAGCTLAPGADLEPGREVWWHFTTKEAAARAGTGAARTVDLLIEANELRAGLEEKLSERGVLTSSRYAFDHGTCALELTFEEFLTSVAPLTHFGVLLRWVATSPVRTISATLRKYQGGATDVPTEARGWLAELVLAVVGETIVDRDPPVLARRLKELVPAVPDWRSAPLTRVSLNRSVESSVTRSRRTVKADAAALLFGVRCDQVRWAVVDSGIDARHDEFRAVEPGTAPSEDGQQNDPMTSRVEQTFDFTRLRDERSRSVIQRVDKQGPGDSRREGVLPDPVVISRDLARYVPPAHPHGTHIAGIIGGRSGLCPDIRLYDYRVLDGAGRGREFAVVAALRDILDRNRKHRESSAGGRSRDLLIHGVNLSLSLNGDVPSDACGWSLVCRVCDELVRSGVVVVVAAGNSGYERAQEWQELSYGHYRTVSIADPGNTERVITVGSTHPDRPLEHGISYFSARGPTADGRLKPDLVAPGDGIESAYGFRTPDDDIWTGTLVESGTSQAAAHVSGCAAMVLARNRELIGKPEEVKAILLRTATDLGRDRNFQGHGLVDVLRALQEI